LPEHHIIGWDLGGAHLKTAWLDGAGSLRQVQQQATPLWQGLSHLGDALARLAREWPLEEADHYLTMTAELVDRFEERRQGVAELAAFMAGRLPSERLWLYAGPAGFVSAAEAGRLPDAIASANWYATSDWVARQQGEALLLDVGSTTADLLLLRSGRPDNRGYTDRERLASGELVYTGVVRTPVMAVASRVPFGGAWQGLCAEHFANMADVYRVLERLPADADLHPSCDGRDKGPEASMRRLARMIGADLSDAGAEDWRQLARYLAERQLDQLTRAALLQCSRGLAPQAPFIGAGAGRFLVQQLADRLERPFLDIDALLGPAQSGELAPAVCAPAVAVARLGQQESAPCN